MTQIGDEWSEIAFHYQTVQSSSIMQNEVTIGTFEGGGGGGGCILSCIECKYVYSVYIKTSMLSISLF